MSQFTLTPYVFLSGISTATAIVAWLFLLNRPPSDFARYLKWFAFSISIRGIFSTLFYAATSITLKSILIKLTFIGLFGSAIFMLLAVVYFTGNQKMITPARLWLLCGYAGISFLLTITNEWHHLIASPLAPIDPRTNLSIYELGPLWWLAITGYVYAIYTVVQVLLLRAAFRFVYPANLHALLMFIVILIPIFGNLFVTMEVVPNNGFDPSTILSVIITLFITIGASYFGLLDNAPIDYRQAINKLTAPIFFVDAREKLRYMNDAARVILSSSNNPFSLEGKPIKLGENVVLPDLNAPKKTSIEISNGNEVRTYVIRVTTQQGSTSKSAGVTVVMNDITLLQQAMLAIQNSTFEKEREALLEEQSQTVERLFGGIEHDLDTIVELLKENKQAAALGVVNSLSLSVQNVDRDIRGTLLDLTSQMSGVRDLPSILQAYITKFQMIADVKVQISFPEGGIEGLLTEQQLFVLLLATQETLAIVRNLPVVGWLQLLFSEHEQNIMLTISFNAAAEVEKIDTAMRQLAQRDEEVSLRWQTRGIGQNTTLILEMPKLGSSSERANLIGETMLLLDERGIEAPAVSRMLREAGIDTINIFGAASRLKPLIESANASILLIHSDTSIGEIENAINNALMVDPAIRIVYFGARPSDQTLNRIVNDQAKGYLYSNYSKEHFLSGLASVLSGKTYFNAETTDRLTQVMRSDPDTARSRARQQLSRFGLSPKQIHITELIAAGMIYKQIGAEVSLSEASIKYNADKIQIKLGVKSRAELIRKLAELGINPRRS